jgi:hypothetical protein
MQVIKDRIDQFQKEGVASALIFGFSAIPVDQPMDGEPDAALKVNFSFEKVTPIQAVAAIQILANWTMKEVGNGNALDNIKAVLDDLYKQREFEAQQAAKEQQQ